MIIYQIKIQTCSLIFSTYMPDKYIFNDTYFYNGRKDYLLQYVVYLGNCYLSSTFSSRRTVRTFTKIISSFLNLTFNTLCPKKSRISA